MHLHTEGAKDNRYLLIGTLSELEDPRGYNTDATVISPSTRVVTPNFKVFVFRSHDAVDRDDTQEPSSNGFQNLPVHT